MVLGFFYGFLHERKFEIVTEREISMDKEMLESIEEKVQEAVRGAIEDNNALSKYAIMGAVKCPNECSLSCNTF